MSSPELAPEIMPKQPRILRAVLIVVLATLAIPVLLVLAEIVLMLGGELLHANVASPRP